MRPAERNGRRDRRGRLARADRLGVAGEVNGPPPESVDVPVPQLFVQGSKDALATPKLLRKALKKIPAARHLEIEGGDHSLARSRTYPMRDADEWLEPVADFVREVTA